MRKLLRLGFLASVAGLAIVASLIVDSIGAPGARARVALAGDPVDIEIYGGGGPRIITFGTVCNTLLVPGLNCTDVLEIRNIGDLDFTYTIETWSDTNDVDDGLGGIGDDEYVACINVHLQFPVADGFNAGNSPTHGPLDAGRLNARDGDTWGLEVTVDDDNACQGQAATIFARVVATGPVEDEDDKDDGDDDDSRQPTPTPTSQRDDDDDPTPTPTPSPTATRTLAPAVVGQVQRPQTSQQATPQPVSTEPQATGQPRPPSAGDGGLIGRRKEAGGPNAWLLGLALGLAISGTICFYAGFVLDARRQRS
jgi:hypothetical protein